MKILKSKQLKILIKAAIAAAAAALASAVAIAVINLRVTGYAEKYLYGYVFELPEADAVMVLGAHVYNNGIPSPVLRDRLDYALEVYNAGKAKKILLTGDHGGLDYDEVNAMKDYLLDCGVPREDLFLDHAGFNTYDSMYRAKKIFCVESLIISTQKFHISRAVYIARRLGIEACGYPCEDKKIYNMAYLSAREWLARAKAFADTDIFRREPKFLGDKIPITGSGLVTDG